MPDEDLHEDASGEQPSLDPSIWGDRLASEVERAREMGIESHTRLVDIDAREHDVELSEDVERIEEEGRHVRIWLRSAGLVTVTGGAVAAAVALIRHRRKARGQ